MLPGFRPYHHGVRTMSATIGSGSVTDRIHSVAITLKECPSLAAVEGRYSAITHTLDGLAERITFCRRRGGVPMGVAPALRWLDQVVRDHPPLDGPEGAPIREELRALVSRLRLLAGR
jgi:hypothetical protein